MTYKARKTVARYWKTASKVTFDACDKQELYEVLRYAEQVIRQLDAELLVLAVTGAVATEAVA